MNEQAENELIAEKLLGWRRLPIPGESGLGWKRPNDSELYRDTPTFTTWDEAGLIFDRMAPHAQDRSHVPGGANGRWFHEHIAEAALVGELRPDAIRTAALAYIRSQK